MICLFDKLGRGDTLVTGLMEAGAPGVPRWNIQ